MTEDTNERGGSWLDALRRVGREVLYVDLRSLAAMRIGLGAVIIGDLATRARHLTAHYTELGVAPQDVVREDYGASCVLSVHWWLSGSPPAVMALFVLNGVLAALLAAGWHTRIMTALCWYLLASLHTRLQLLHTAGDTTLQLLLFWSLFLPLGARWSLDARRTSGMPADADRYVSPAGFALLAQVAFIYLFAVAHKILTPIWRDGEAVLYALNVDSYPTAVGAWLRQFEGALSAFTLATLAWELIGPLLPFIPGITALGRIVAVLGFWALHLGFGLSFNLGIFPFISSVAWLAFLPTELWDRWLPGSAAPAGAPPRRFNRWAGYAALAALGLVFLVNVRSVRIFRGLVPSPVTKLAGIPRLRQSWSMFTEFAYTGPYSGWYVVEATRDGAAGAGDREPVDLLTGAPRTWEPPRYATERYGTARWTQFHYYYPDPLKSPYWAPYSEWLCRTAAGGDARQPVERVAIWYLMRVRDALGAEQIVKVQLHEHACGEPDR